MHETLIAYPIGIAIAVAIHLIRERGRRRAYDAELDDMAGDSYGEMPAPAGESTAKKERGAGVYLALWGAYKSLTEQRAHGYRGWLSSCIRHAQGGEMIPAAVAIRALELTRSELSGSRYSLAGIDAALALLKKEEGEGV